jgi:hypothetical protein
LTAAKSSVRALKLKSVPVGLVGEAITGVLISMSATRAPASDCTPPLGATRFASATLVRNGFSTAFVCVALLPALPEMLIGSVRKTKPFTPEASGRR